MFLFGTGIPLHKKILGDSLLGFLLFLFSLSPLDTYLDSLGQSTLFETPRGTVSLKATCFSLNTSYKIFLKKELAMPLKMLLLRLDLVLSGDIVPGIFTHHPILHKFRRSKTRKFLSFYLSLCKHFLHNRLLLLLL